MSCNSSVGLHGLSRCNAVRLAFRHRPCTRPAQQRAAGKASQFYETRPLDPDSSTPPVKPLRERAADHVVSASALLRWYKEAIHATRGAAAGWIQPDDPSAEDLLRELRWLVEDATEQPWPLGLHRNWEQDPVNLRLPIPDLHVLWDRRLKERVPLQYLTNSAHWRDLVLAVGPGVLIPRPETECLIESALEVLATGMQPALASGIWADLGTGSGALALGLATSQPEVKQVLAVDRSPAACAWASFNIQRLGLTQKIQVKQGSWFAPLAHLRGQLSGILSNPPYIARHVMPSLQAEVRVHEPSSALEGGDSEGFKCLQEICSEAAEYLVPGGFVGLETGGPHQTAPVARMLEAAFSCIEKRKDMYGVERFVIARRK